MDKRSDPVHRRVGAWSALVAVVVAVIAVVVPATAAPVGADANEAPGSPGIYRSITAGSDQTCVRLGDGHLRCWGGASSGKLGHGNTTNLGDGPNEMSNQLLAVELGTDRTVTSASAGGAFTCAALDTGALKCFGSRTWGFISGTVDDYAGDAPNEMSDNLAPINLGGAGVVDLSAGTNDACVIITGGGVRCMGVGWQGQLGNGADGYYPSAQTVQLGTGRTATAITASLTHTCARLDDASLKCWGAGVDGELGIAIPGTNTNAGDKAGEMGDNLPTVNLGTGRTTAAVTTGTAFTCAVLDDGSVKCWGKNAAGQLGLGDTTSRGAIPASQMGDSLPTVDLGTGRTATAISAGTDFACALLDNGSVKCWGGNQYGQLGLGDTNPRGDAPGEMGDSLPAVDLGTGRTAIALTAGDSHVCAVLDNSTVKCWGRNQSGQLGLGDTNNRGDAPGEMGDNLPVVPVGTDSLHGIIGSTTGQPVSGVLVAVLRTSDFSLAALVPDFDAFYTLDVPVGEYYLYVIEKTGAYQSGWHGSPTPVVIPSNVSVNVTLSLTPTRGSIGGTVTDAITANPVAGAWVAALTSTSGTFERGVTADASGQFTIPNLNVGSHLVIYLDSTGAHPARFHPNVASASNATHLNVTAGATTDASAAIDSQAAAATNAALTGKVTDAVTSANLAGIQVIALRSSDFTFMRGTTTNSSGNYTLNLPLGTYKIGFIDPTGVRAMEWYNDQSAQSLATATDVPAPSTNINAPLARAAGAISGTVTSAPATPVPAAWMVAVGSSGIVGAATTAANGTYTLNSVPADNYRAIFLNPASTTLEYWLDAPDYDSATAFAVAAGSTTPIDATISP